MQKYCFFYENENVPSAGAERSNCMDKCHFSLWDAIISPSKTCGLCNVGFAEICTCNAASFAVPGHYMPVHNVKRMRTVRCRTDFAL